MKQPPKALIPRHPGTTDQMMKLTLAAVNMFVELARGPLLTVRKTVGNSYDMARQYLNDPNDEVRKYANNIFVETTIVLRIIDELIAYQKHISKAAGLTPEEIDRRCMEAAKRHEDGLPPNDPDTVRIATAGTPEEALKIIKDILGGGPLPASKPKSDDHTHGRDASWDN